MKRLALTYPTVRLLLPTHEETRTPEELLAEEAASKMAELRRNLYVTLDAVNEGDLDLLAEISYGF